jgi:lambda family phage portal protein
MSRRMKVRQNAVDRVIGWVSPKAGFERARYRAALALTSGYTAARRDRSATKGWATTGGSADADTLPDLDLLRERSRDLVRNDPLAQSAISTKVVNVIGSGHVVRPEIDHERLGLGEKDAEAWESDALAIWMSWAQSQDCDVTRTQTFAELEDLVYRSRLLSGDVMAIRRFKDREGGLLGSCFQIVEADRLSNPDWKGDSETLAGGIELDGDGAQVAFHFANRHAFDRHRQGAVSWRRVPAYAADGRRLVLHIRGVRWRPDMTRYAPMLAPVIESLKQRSRYSEAELMAAVVSACFAIGMKSDDGALGDALAPQSGGDSSSASSDLIIDEPGKIFDLLPDEEIQSFKPGRPNPMYEPFVKAIAQEVGAGTDLPFELLVKQFQASYSASRAAMEMAWQFFRTDRNLHVTQFCKPAYEDVITEAVARGLLAAPGFLTDPLRRQAYLNATWMGPARPTLDPVKDAKADELYLNMGVTSKTRIAAERFGVDLRDVQRRRAKDGSDQTAADPSDTSDQDKDEDEDAENESDLETS